MLLAQYCDPRPNTILAVAGCDTADACAQATARTDVYGALLQNFTNGTDLKGPPNPLDSRMPRTGRWGFAAAVLNGNLGFGPKVYIIGGVVTTRLVPGHRAQNAVAFITNTTEVLNQAGIFTTGPELNVARWGHAAAAMGGMIYVVGGCSTSFSWNTCQHPLDSAEVFDPGTRGSVVLG
eukprot:COSAG01_NODE_1371_length_10547_cov_22.320827_3_plen_179_part_00